MPHPPHPDLSSDSARTQAFRQLALEHGFSLVGFTPAATPRGLDHFQNWLQRGFAGQMGYLAGRRAAYEHPRHVLTSVRSLIVLALPYSGTEAPPVSAGEGRVARYAWSGSDYHDVIHDRLRTLIGVLRTWQPDVEARGIVDTAPVLERDLAREAGLGWIGKNTMLLHPRLGSWFFLAAILTNLEWEYDEPFATDHCGTCRACLEACPTQAFPEPYVLDARRCLSYLTIELRGPVPDELRSGMGEWVFGCDVCQDVCPWNRKADLGDPLLAEPRADWNPLELGPLLLLTPTQFRERFRHTPLARSKRAGLLRNAALVLGGQKHLPALPYLGAGLTDDEPLVRGACAWALGQLGGSQARRLLEARQELEPDAAVREELHRALAAIADGNEPATSSPD